VNRWEVSVTSERQRLVLTRAQAACLDALRRRSLAKSEIAIEAKLSLNTTAKELDQLADLGLAKKSQDHRWNITARGKTCRFESVPTRRRRDSTAPGPAGKRLLGILDKPMRQSDIAEKLAVSLQRVHQLIIKLHAIGCVRFADPARPSWLVMKAESNTSFLSRDAERVLSVVPRDYATGVNKISSAVHMPSAQVQRILQSLISASLVISSEGLDGLPAYRIAVAGLKHPQRIPKRHLAEAPRLPVESDRVRAVLSTIHDAGPLRIVDVTELLRMPRQSLNALFQYLKRKQLVTKVGDDFYAPYSLTDHGRAMLKEMTRRAA
jgi:DNA-binding IclR family transcriptional regulator